MPHIALDGELLEKNSKFWESRYQENKIEWHIEKVHPILLKHLNTLLPPNSPPKKIFIPLCGKTKDIPFLYALGHEVFGVESVASAIEELNTENNLGMTFDPKTSLYQTSDGRVKIYCGDMFKCQIEHWGPFDCIWDRGSFVAIDYPLREAYMDVIQRALAINTGHKFRYLIQTVRYDKALYPGPPRAVDEKDVAKWFSPWASVQQLDSYLVPNNSPMMKVVNGALKELHEVFLLLTNKE